MAQKSVVPGQIPELFSTLVPLKENHLMIIVELVSQSLVRSWRQELNAVLTPTLLIVMPQNGQKVQHSEQCSVSLETRKAGSSSTPNPGSSPLPMVKRAWFKPLNSNKNSKREKKSKQREENP